jgi:Kdo2-lipid IVA lauroyltransferase/acyltransferase
MLNFLSKILASLPLSVVHGLGGMLGWIMHLCTPATAKIQHDNIVQSALFNNKTDFQSSLNANIGETGKAILETLAIWQKNEVELLALVKQVHSWEIVKDALQLGKGIIFLTPHLGCFEITSIYYGSKHPITVLYRAPKQNWLMPLIQAGRARTGVTLAEANASGVRKLMQALKRGEAIGILPDQIPAAGEGEWADFFGKPAYTMTLASKLAEKTGATVIMAYGERLAHGAGYEIHLQKLVSIATPTLLNKAIEQQVAQKPTQYLWRYNRYKMRRHAMNKEGATTIQTD